MTASWVGASKGGWRTRHRGADFDVSVVTDAAGHRVQDRPKAGPAPGGLLFVGDSLTFGWGVRAEDSFAERLGAELLLPVTNLGVPGYGTDQSYLALRREIASCKPRVTVYTFCANDLAELAHRIR